MSASRSSRQCCECLAIRASSAATSPSVPSTRCCAKARIVSLASGECSSKNADSASCGDVRPLHAFIDSVAAKDPKAAAPISDKWLSLAFCERDSAAAERALSTLATDGCKDEGIPFPRSWCEGMVARLRGDDAAARSAFMRAREEMERLVHEEPAYAEALCVLGMIDAMLAKKEEAIQEGRRAVELLPVSKDALNGARVAEYLTVIYATVGEKKRAIEQLSIITRRPSWISYGELRLHPYWEPLRGDPQFDRIVASLAPKEQ